MTDPYLAESVLFPPLDVCPGCRAQGLQAKAAGDQTIFFCPACRCFWHVDLGRAHQVNPAGPGHPHHNSGLAGPGDHDEPAHSAAAGC